MSKAPSSHKTGKNRLQQAAAPAPPDAGALQGLLESPAVHLLLLALVAFAAYANTFHTPFVFDDDSSIVNNPAIKDLSTFLSGAGYAYNPRRFIGYLSFALNYRFGGLDVAGYHAVNLAIHIFTAWLVYYLVRLTLRTPFFVNRNPGVHHSPSTIHYSLIPLITALLFVAHPVQTQAVTYVVQRLASLATMFYLLSLVLYIKARLSFETSEGRVSNHSPFTIHRSPYLFFALSLISAILAMRTKEIAATLPLVVVLYEFSFFGASARKKLIFLIPLLLTVLIIPLGMLHTGKPLGELLSDVSEMARESRVISRGDYLLTQFSVIVTYIRLLLLPVNQNLDYDYPIYDSPFAPRVFFSFLLLLILFGLAIYLYYRSRDVRHAKRSPFTIHHSRLIAFGILWFFITLSVESSIIPITDVIYEHRLYLPSVGAFIALTALASLFFRSCAPRTLAAGAALLIILLTTVTWQRNLVWGDVMTLWMDNVEKAPGKDRPHNNLGKYLADKRRLDEAIPHLLAAVKSNPANFEARYNLGFACLKQGQTDLAIEHLQRALKMKPDNADARFRLGSALAKKGETVVANEYYQTAIEQYLQAIKVQPNDMDAHFKLSIVYQKQSRLDEAIGELLETLRLNPDHAEAHNNLGVVYGMKGDPDKALEHLQAAERLNPGDPGAHDNLANVYNMKGLKTKAADERAAAEKLAKGEGAPGSR